MIVFDLKCAGGHIFEAWFGSSEDYDAQSARALVACPMCGSAQTGKAVMAPAVPAKGNRSAPVPHAAHTPEEIKTFLTQMAAVQTKVETDCDYVGDRFADEARAIHLGEAETRGIYGEATPAEAEALRDDGIAVAPLPFRPRRIADA